MTGHGNHAASINRRTALIGLGTGLAAMRWSRVAAAEDPVVETAPDPDEDDLDDLDGWLTHVKSCIFQL